MTDQPKQQSEARSRRDGPSRREERLAAALKANLTRRKAQARLRAEGPAANSDKPAKLAD